MQGYWRNNGGGRTERAPGHKITPPQGEVDAPVEPIPDQMVPRTHPVETGRYWCALLMGIDFVVR